MDELRMKIHQTIQTADKETLKNVLKNLKAQLNLVVRVWGGDLNI